MTQVERPDPIAARGGMALPYGGFCPSAMLILSLLLACEQGGGAPPTSPDALRNMAPRTPENVSVVPSAGESEPNDERSTATRVQLSSHMVVLQAELTGGSKDVDFWHVLPVAGASLVSVSVLPKSERDIYLVVSDLSGKQRFELDDGLPGEVEAIPNLRISPEGLILELRGRGEASIRYELTLTTLSGIDGLEAEPNEHPDDAVPVQAPASMSAFVNRAGDVDYFRLTSSLPSFDLSLTAPNELPLEATLWHADAVLWQARLNAGSSQGFRRLRGASESYLLRVEALGVARGVPSYRLDLTPSLQSENGELEPNDLIAQPLPGPGSLKASLSGASDVDRFSLSIAPTEGTQYLSVRAIPSGDAELILEVFGADGVLLQRRDEPGPGKPKIVCNLPVQPGSFELRLSSASGSASSSAMEQPYELLSSVQVLEDMEQEPNDTVEQANPMGPSRQLKGQLYPAGDIDVFSFTLEPAAAAMQRVELRVAEGYMGNLALELRDSSNASISKADRMGFSEAERLMADLPAGSYFVLLSGRGEATCTSPYHLSLSLTEVPDTLPVVGPGPEPGSPGSEGVPPLPLEATKPELDDDGF